MKWSYDGTPTSSLVHALTGNKRHGYRVAIWNCRRGLVSRDGSPTSKVTDIQLYIDKHQLDLFRIVEADLHGATSWVVRANPLKTTDITENL